MKKHRIISERNAPDSSGNTLEAAKFPLRRSPLFQTHDVTFPSYVLRMYGSLLLNPDPGAHATLPHATRTETLRKERAKRRWPKDHRRRSVQLQRRRIA
jgi:hypothetical protein